MISQGYQRIDHSYQLFAQVGHTVVKNSDVFVSSCRTIFLWAKRKFAPVCADFPNQLRTFSNESSGTNQIGILIDYEKKYFALRTSHSDPEIAGRSWITEAEIFEKEDKYYLSVRNMCEYYNIKYKEIESIAPNFVGSISKTQGLYDAGRKIDTIWNISNDNDLDLLRDHLVDPSRFLPIIVISECAGICPEREFYPSGYLLESDKLLASIGKHAHIVILPNHLTRNWSDRVGRMWGVYDGAIRTYYPGADLNGDEFYYNPLITKIKIMSMYVEVGNKTLIAGKAAEYTIIEKIKTRNIKMITLWRQYGTKFYAESKREYALNSLNRMKTEVRDLYEGDKQKIERLENELDVWRELANDYAADLDKKQDYFDLEKSRFEESIEMLEKRIFNITAKIANLEQIYIEKTGSNADTNIPIYTDYNQLPEWIDTYFPEKLVLTNRAFNSLKDAQYEDIELVYKAIKILAFQFRDMKLRDADKVAFDTALQNLKLEDGLSVTDIGAGMQDEEYYTLYKGTRRLMDKHICKGNSREPKNCLRIYYFWDPDDSVVVIGHLPSHLRTRST